MKRVFDTCLRQLTLLESGWVQFLLTTFDDLGKNSATVYISQLCEWCLFKLGLLQMFYTIEDPKCFKMGARYARLSKWQETCQCMHLSVDPPVHSLQLLTGKTFSVGYHFSRLKGTQKVAVQQHLS